MREIMINRIYWMMYDGWFSEEDKYKQVFNSSRWCCVGEFLYRTIGEDPDTKHGRKVVKQSCLADYNLNNFPDTVFIQLFEMVVRRYSTQM